MDIPQPPEPGQWQVSFDQQHVTTAEGAYVRFFEAATLQQLKQHKLTAPAESASYCALKRKFVAGGEDMWVHLYDYDTGQVRPCPFKVTLLARHFPLYGLGCHHKDSSTSSCLVVSVESARPLNRVLRICLRACLCTVGHYHFVRRFRKDAQVAIMCCVLGCRSWNATRATTGLFTPFVGRPPMTHTPAVLRMAPSESGFQTAWSRRQLLEAGRRV